MSIENTSDKAKSWLAAEYALGVCVGDARREAERLIEHDAAFRKSVDAWQNHLSPMLDDVGDVKPPASVWKHVEEVITGAGHPTSNQIRNSSFWKLIAGLTSTVAAACLGGLLYISGGDFTSGSVSELKQRLEASQGNIANANSAFAEARDRSKALELKLAEATTKLENATTELAQMNGSLEQANQQTTDALSEVADAKAEVENLRQQYESTRPLVASLTQSGDAPAFVAQYDPLKKALLILTAVENTDEKVPEIWLIPAQGTRKGEVLSLGVMNENAPDEVKITDEFVELIGEGGTLAITMEPPGGSPTGVATGPVIALGKLQSF